jgi:hypothetical protein
LIEMSLKWTSKQFCRGALVVVVAMLAAGVVIAYWRHQHSRADGHAEIPVLAGTIPAATNAGFSNTAAGSSVLSALELSRREALYASFQRHPFPVTRESEAFGWTAEDGKNPGVIKQLAHNELEYERMAEESARIFRRQLVYHKETADAQIQRAKLTGEPIQQLSLPGLDGQEVQFEITKADLSPSGQQGAFSGHLAGRLDSMVTFAFKGGREAFTILSPSDGLYLVGEPREPGELIVKSINPETYVVGVCGNP